MREWFRRYYHHLIKLVAIALFHPEDRERFAEQIEELQKISQERHRR